MQHSIAVVPDPIGVPVNQNQEEDRSHSSDEEGRWGAEEITRIVLRPLATPLPLAFFAFGIGSFLLSGQQLGLIPQDETKLVALVLGLFVFPLEALAAVFALLARESLGATALGIFSASWLTTAVTTYTQPPGSTAVTLGLFQLVLMFALVLLGISGVSGKPLISAIILLAAVRFGLDGLYELTSFTALEFVSGIFGVVVFLFAFYGGLALVLEDLQHRTVLPFGRRGEALDAIEGDIGDQVGPLEQEPGVRKQL